jgi:hypothetical protein
MIDRPQSKMIQGTGEGDRRDSGGGGKFKEIKLGAKGKILTVDEKQQGTQTKVSSKQYETTKTYI